jgi:hypothetical protein
MDNSESVLTQEEAQVLALACLTKRWPGTLWRIHEDEALDRGFGWVFSIEAIDEEARIEHGQRMSPHLVLVNKRSRQVVTSRRHTAVGLAKDYEVLLALSRAEALNWCSTMSGGHRAGIPAIAEEGRRAGLEDISVNLPSDSYSKF